MEVLGDFVWFFFETKISRVPNWPGTNSTVGAAWPPSCFRPVQGAVLCSAGDQTQGLVHARQTQYELLCSQSPGFLIHSGCKNA